MSWAQIKRNRFVRGFLILAAILTLIAGVVDNFAKICDGFDKMYEFIKGHRLSTDDTNSLASITNAAEKELAQSSTKRNSDWFDFRKDANDKWLTGLKIPSGPEAEHIKVSLVPKPGEPTFTISQQVMKGLVNVGDYVGFQGDSITVNIRSDAPGGAGFGVAFRNGKPLNISGRDGGTIMIYMEDSWSKTFGRLEGPHDFGDVTVMFEDRKYAIRAPAGLNADIYEDSGSWQKHGAPMRMRINGPMSLEVYGVEPKELFTNTVPPDWYMPLPSKAEIVELLTKAYQEQPHSDQRKLGSRIWPILLIITVAGLIVVSLIFFLASQRVVHNRKMVMKQTGEKWYRYAAKEISSERGRRFLKEHFAETFERDRVKKEKEWTFVQIAALGVYLRLLDEKGNDATHYDTLSVDNEAVSQARVLSRDAIRSLLPKDNV